MARTSTYLNFPGNTEKAFLFYKTIFGGDFLGGVARFGDMPAQTGSPPLTDAVKKMILHIEIAITGGHILMATDAPESRGFQVRPGNQMHINLEPDTREEADRLFKALSAGGKIDMPLQDAFWGAYYGSCTDKFGVNWMVNVANR